MSEHVDLDKMTYALLAAYESRTPVEPLTSTAPQMTVEDAYAIQSAQVDAWAADGRVVRGYKVGLTSRAMQEMLGVDQPDYGYLVDGMYFDEGASVSRSRFIAPRVEPEISVILSHDLTGPGLSLRQVESAVGSVVGALEIIDSRIKDWRITLADTIADNASSGGVVVGRQEVDLAAVDVVALEVTLRKNGVDVSTGTGADVMGNPLEAVRWLANRLGELGVTLKAGALVIPGSVCAAVPVAAGDRIEADFGPLGTVSIRFGE